MTLPWLPWPRLFSMDPRMRAVSAAARGLFYDLASASDDNGSVWVPVGCRWIDVCATLSGQAHTEVEKQAEQLRRVGLVEAEEREIYLPDVVRWQEGVRGASAPVAPESPGEPASGPVSRDPKGLLRVHFSNRKLRTAEARRAWLATDAAAGVLARLGLDRATAEELADRAGQRGGHFAVGNQAARKNGSKAAPETAVRNGSKAYSENGSKPVPSLTLSPSEKDKEDQQQTPTEGARETAVRDGSKERQQALTTVERLGFGAPELAALLYQKAAGKVLAAGADARVLADLQRVMDELARGPLAASRLSYETLVDWYVAGSQGWRKEKPLGLVELAKPGTLGEHLEQALAWSAARRPKIEHPSPGTLPGLRPSGARRVGPAPASPFPGRDYDAEREALLRETEADLGR